MLNGKRISVIIPAYNEEKRIGNVLQRMPEFVDEVIVVDDGSRDRTSEVAKKFGVKVIRLKQNQGKGKAMSEGIKAASGDIIVFMDADGQHKPEEIIKLVEPIVEDEADFVIGSRLIKAQGERPLIRKISNFITTSLIRLKLGINVKDTQSGFRAIRREFLPEIESRRYEVETEVLIKVVKKGARIKEVPVSMIYGIETGHFRFEDIVRFLEVLLKY
ncbi:glycosyltransferase family 2 protein [Thermococcus sp. M39]|uniref:glycosyltransferase family 2 protein n=1 Tax=unclassified Thermococcus TaxID=2627626 RepID=UPI00143C427F|nr:MULTISPECIES: glycosyltransferase family 2 protein [unclassified Thermococcus]NJE08712.1 glycosyltransferase family 2 protein [Thermococcus sp. M39]NJE12987.1 glycosyltransferase family 2 protein [Thermococcus sp. LS2]